MMQSLKALPCFNHIDSIEPIIAGLSSNCYQIQADNKYFFVKQITTVNEPAVSLHAAKKNITPKVIYHDKHWLVSQYIEGKNLSVNQKTIDEKIIIAIKLMTQCHKINIQTEILKPEVIAEALINKIHACDLTKNDLQQLANQLISPLQHNSKLVCCHGDLNFSNILISQHNNAYLVDYECACTAPAEYDLAMFIAVNNLAEDKSQAIIQHYTKQTSIDINLTLLNHYIKFCLFINSLWYFDAHNKTKYSKFLSLAKQQWVKIGVNQQIPLFILFK